MKTTPDKAIKPNPVAITLPTLVPVLFSSPDIGSNLFFSELFEN